MLDPVVGLRKFCDVKVIRTVVRALRELFVGGGRGGRRLYLTI